MPIKKSRFLFLLFITVSAFLYSEEQTALLKNDMEKLYLAEYVHILPDIERIYKAGEIVVEQKHDALFVPNKQNSLNFGYGKKSMWVRFKLRNTSNQEKWFLETANPTIDSIELYTPDQKGSFEVRKTGYIFPYKQREIDNRCFVFSLHIPRGEEQTIYMRFETTENMYFPLSIWTPAAFEKKDHTEKVLFGIYMGIILIMLCYNLILYFTVKEKIFLWYLLYIAAFSFTLLSGHGIIYAYFWPSFLTRYNHYISIILPFLVFTIIHYAQSFLNLKKHLPKVHKILHIFKIIALLSMAFSIFKTYIVPTDIHFPINIYLTLIVSVICYSSAVILTFKKVKEAYYFTIAWFFLFIGALMYCLVQINLVPHTFFTEHTVLFGSVIEILFISVGIANRINRMKNKIIEQDKAYIKKQQVLIDSFQRFVPKQFLSILNYGNIVDIKAGDQVLKNLTILFSDIRDFTSLSEQMTPQENFDFLNSYLKRMGPVIREHEGFIDKYIGDAIMALFPAGVEQALDAAIHMIKTLHEYNAQRTDKNYDRVNIGIGIHTGTCILGTIGDENRMDGTVISDAVNTASRLEGVTRTYKARVIISEEIACSIQNQDKYKIRTLGEVKMKGKTQKVTIFELLNCYTEKEMSLKVQTKDIFEEGVHFFLEQEYKKAGESFARVITLDKKDQVAEHYLKTCIT